MNDDRIEQGPLTERDPQLVDSHDDAEEIDIYLDDDDFIHGPESWRDIADTLADPVEPS